MTTTANPPHCAPRRAAPCLLALAAACACVCAGPVHASTDLTALSLEQLLDVSVVGASKYEQKQSEVAAAVSVITRQEIAAFGWQTLADALASLPGVHTTYDRQYTYLGTRGFGLPGDLTTRVLIAVNGNRVNDPVYDGGPSGREFPLDLSLVERIEFIPGPGGAVYGQNAMFGVVNVITRRGVDLSGTELAAIYQHPQTLRAGRASWGRQLDNGVDVLLSASRLRSRGEDLRFEFGSTGVSGVATGLDAARDQEFYARVARGAWSLDLLHGNSRKDDPTASYFSDPLVAGGYAQDRYTLGQLQVLDSFAGDTLQVSARLFAGAYRYDGDAIYGTPLASPAAGDWRGAEARVLATAVAGHKLMAGVEWQDNLRTDQAALDRAEPANDIRNQKSGYRVGLYAQDEWQVTNAVTATLGLRIDRNNTTGSHSSPRAALIWQAAPATTLKALLGRAHRAPNVNERDYDDQVSQVPNPALRGETVDTREAVLDHRASPDLALRASLYRWAMHGLITLGVDPASGLTQFHSGERVQARGLELSVDKTWANGTRLRSSASLQDVAYASGSALPNSPKVLGKLNLSGPLPWAGVHAGAELRCDSPRLSLDGTRLPGYSVANLHLSTSAVARGLTLSLGVQNLFDKRYAQPGADTNWQNALEQDGRSVRIAATFGY